MWRFKLACALAVAFALCLDGYVFSLAYGGPPVLNTRQKSRLKKYQERKLLKESPLNNISACLPGVISVSCLAYPMGGDGMSRPSDPYVWNDVRWSCSSGNSLDGCSIAIVENATRSFNGVTTTLPMICHTERLACNDQTEINFAYILQEGLPLAPGNYTVTMTFFSGTCQNYGITPFARFFYTFTYAGG